MIQELMRIQCLSTLRDLLAQVTASRNKIRRRCALDLDEGVCL